MSPTSIVAYLALFAAVGFAFLFVSLMIGRLLRPRSPSPAKLATYECGEPSVGSSYVQFDLRFYVVALVFIIFDVEVAFFFPWATVFGKARELMAIAASEGPADGEAGLDPAAALVLRELAPGHARAGPNPPAAAGEPSPQETGRTLALAAMADIAVFFAVLMVGFVFVWYRGDLDWVRAMPQAAAPEADRAGGPLAA